jgi:hypothetical protein
VAHAFDGIAAQRGVGGDHAVHGVALERGGDHGDLGFVEVGRDLHEDGHTFAVLRGQGLAAFGDAAQQGVERLVALQRAQVLGVGAGDVDGDVVGMRVDAVQADQVVVDRVFNRRGGVLADVQAQQQAALRAGLAHAGAPHIGQEGVQAFVVEAQAVDQRIGLGQAEHARLGVAGLALGGDGADFDKAETHGGQAVDAAGVFVQPGGQADAVGKFEAGQLDRVADAAGQVGQRQRRALGARQRGHGQLVGGFGVQAK